MTNYEYLKSCEQDDFAWIIVGMFANILEQATRSIIPQAVIDKEFTVITQWLESETVQGELLN